MLIESECLSTYNLELNSLFVKRADFILKARRKDMGFFDFLKSGMNHSAIMHDILEDLNKQMSTIVTELEHQKIEVNIVLYYSFMLVYVSEIYRYSMLHILNRRLEQVHENTKAFWGEAIDNAVIRYKTEDNDDMFAMKLSIAQSLNKTILDFGYEFKALFGNKTIDNGMIKPVSSKFLHNICEVEGLDHIKGHIETTLHNITYKYITAWN